MSRWFGVVRSNSRSHVAHGIRVFLGKHEWIEIDLSESSFRDDGVGTKSLMLLIVSTAGNSLSVNLSLIRLSH